MLNNTLKSELARALSMLELGSGDHIHEVEESYEPHQLRPVVFKAGLAQAWSTCSNYSSSNSSNSSIEPTQTMSDINSVNAGYSMQRFLEADTETEPGHVVDLLESLEDCLDAISKMADLDLDAVQPSSKLWCLH